MTGWIKVKDIRQERPINAQIELHVARIQTVLMFVEGIINCLYEFYKILYISFLSRIYENSLFRIEIQMYELHTFYIVR